MRSAAANMVLLQWWGDYCHETFVIKPLTVARIQPRERGCEGSIWVASGDACGGGCNWCRTNNLSVLERAARAHQQKGRFYFLGL